MTLLNEEYLKVTASDGTVHIYDTLSDIDPTLDFVKIEKISKSLLDTDALISILEADAENANYHDMVGVYRILRTCLDGSLAKCHSAKYGSIYDIVNEFFYSLAERGGLVP